MGVVWDVMWCRGDGCHAMGAAPVESSTYTSAYSLGKLTMYVLSGQHIYVLTGPSPEWGHSVRGKCESCAVRTASWGREGVGEFQEEGRSGRSRIGGSKWVWVYAEGEVFTGL